MQQFLKQTFDRLLASVSMEKQRFLYASFKPSRMTGLVGPRGVGKTTMMLQYIKANHAEDGSAFYFSADAVYFQNNTLLDLVNELYLTDGIRYFFIDEIHKYRNWNQELKNIYDAFPDIQVVFSGSSMLDLVGGSHDLSRRANIYHLPGLSFREYLHFHGVVDVSTVVLDILLEKTAQLNHIAQVPKIMGHYKQYLASGYYPFALEDPDTFSERLHRVIEKTIYEDIANYYKLKTGNLVLFKKILSYLASIPPGSLNMHSLAQNLQVAPQTVEHYLDILAQVNLVRLVLPKEGGNQRLRKPAKILLNNTVLLQVLAEVGGHTLDVGTQRETYFLQAMADAGHEPYYSKVGDYQVGDRVYEIGGPNKGRKQVSQAGQKGMVVKDDIVVSEGGFLPLMFMGFLY